MGVLVQAGGVRFLDFGFAARVGLWTFCAQNGKRPATAPPIFPDPDHRFGRAGGSRVDDKESTQTLHYSLDVLDGSRPCRSCVLIRRVRTFIDGLGRLWARIQVRKLSEPDGAPETRMPLRSTGKICLRRWR